MIEIAIVGKPNAGKSTFLKAATLADVKIASYPFTTINPNFAIGYVTTKCVCKELGLNCNNCINGIRFIPIKLIDVPGLVPGAHKGRGLGNKFLDDLRQAQAFIHVVDFSGLTDNEGNPTRNHNPLEDIKFLESEIDEWLLSIILRALERYFKTRKRSEFEKIDELSSLIAKQLTGLGINETIIKSCLLELKEELKEDNLREFATSLRKMAKPMLIAANKIDIEEAKENYFKLKDKIDYPIIPCSADYELALRIASKNEIIDYLPGDNDFKIKGNLSEKQIAALEKIRKMLMEFGSTGVQACLNKIVFDLLNYIVVYPVENENKFSDKKGNILPDAFLLPKEAKPIDLAFTIHSNLGENFICAIDAKTKQRVASDYNLKNNDIIKIVTR
ncbi:MAG: redox-regulated ATPase YchF [Candidatus Aenigmatarchaeota archaeon]|nr:redox-regulated ATPase YchF [Candidatus Aenigmarchaeota archaeon]